MAKANPEGWIQLEPIELSAILAGLRMLQAAADSGAVPGPVIDIWMETGEGLIGDDIDVLCESINVAP